jgi:hypothetical protein
VIPGDRYINQGGAALSIEHRPPPPAEELPVINTLVKTGLLAYIFEIAPPRFVTAWLLEKITFVRLGLLPS